MAEHRLRIDQQALGQLLESEQGAVGKDLLRRALRVERRAKLLAPVDTGRLRSSITHELAVDTQGLFALVGSSVEYAAFVELGTRYNRGQPYLRPALAAAR